MESKLTLKRLWEELGKNTRRLESVEKTVNMLSTDERRILEDINARLAGLEEKVSTSIRHDDVIRNDIKDEIKIANDRVVAKVETKIEEVSDQIESRKVVQIKKKGWFQK